MRAHPWESDFTSYVAARSGAVRGLAFALCGDWHTADDLAQMTFIKLYRHWTRVRHETVDAYTRRILVNTFLSRRRRPRREESVAMVPERAAPPDDPDIWMVLRRALDELPPRQRAMVLLRYLEDQPVSVVADLLGVAEGTVKSQTSRALANLRIVLREPLLVRE